MTPLRRMLITDLDNTLYDWVGFFATAFAAMVDELQVLLGIGREDLLGEFKEVHQRVGDSEQPFAVLMLPVVRARFGARPAAEIIAELAPALHAFNAARNEHLRLYPGVGEALAELDRRGTVIVGHTEAMSANAWHRLVKLDVAHHFSRLYCLESDYQGHPIAGRQEQLAPPADVLRTVPRSERKPNPELLRDICAAEGVSASDALYVGDSISRDVKMAHDAGVTSAWAEYGRHHEGWQWDLLVSISHWTDEDVRREEALRDQSGDVRPDHVLARYDELLPLFDPAGALPPAGG